MPVRWVLYSTGTRVMGTTSSHCLQQDPKSTTDAADGTDMRFQDDNKTVIQLGLYENATGTCVAKAMPWPRN